MVITQVNVCACLQIVVVLQCLLLFRWAIRSVCLSEEVIKHLQQHQLVVGGLLVLLLQSYVHLVEGTQPFVNHKSGQDKVLHRVFDRFERLEGHRFLRARLPSRTSTHVVIEWILIQRAELLELGLEHFRYRNPRPYTLRIRHHRILIRTLIVL